MWSGSTFQRKFSFMIFVVATYVFSSLEIPTIWVREEDPTACHLDKKEAFVS